MTRSHMKSWPSVLRRMWWVFLSTVTPSHIISVFFTLNPWICLPQQILNCALDDIEIFVARLQKAAEAFSQLNHRNKSKKNKKKGPAGLSPFLLMWWHECSDNMFILLTSPCLCLFASCGPGLSSSDACVVLVASLRFCKVTQYSLLSCHYWGNIIASYSLPESADTVMYLLSVCFYNVLQLQCFCYVFVKILAIPKES